MHTKHSSIARLALVSTGPRNHDATSGGCWRRLCRLSTCSCLSRPSADPVSVSLDTGQCTTDAREPPWEHYRSNLFQIGQQEGREHPIPHLQRGLVHRHPQQLQQHDDCSPCQHLRSKQLSVQRVAAHRDSGVSDEETRASTDTQVAHVTVSP